MSNTNTPATVVPTLVALQPEATRIRELLDCELLLVGGGQGEVSFN
ncbi:MAG: hypothetical protein ABL985_05990 [Casimicrobium sp.]